jgi:hypothetical protein
MVVRTARVTRPKKVKKKNHTCTVGIISRGPYNLIKDAIDNQVCVVLYDNVGSGVALAFSLPHSGGAIVKHKVTIGLHSCDVGSRAGCTS